MQINYNRVGESASHLDYVCDCCNKLINLLAAIQIPEDEEGMIDISILNSSAGNICTESYRVASLILAFVADAKAVESAISGMSLDFDPNFTASSVIGDGVFEANMTAEEFNNLTAGHFKSVDEHFDSMNPIEFDNQTIQIQPEKYDQITAPSAKEFWETVGLAGTNVGGGFLKFIPNDIQFKLNFASYAGSGFDPCAIVTGIITDTAKSLVMDNMVLKNGNLDDIWNSDSDIATKLKATGAELFSTANSTIFGGVLSNMADEVVGKMEENAAIFYDEAFEIDPKAKMMQEAAGTFLAGAATGLGMEQVGIVPKSPDVRDIPANAEEMLGAVKDFFKNRGTNNSGYSLVVDEVIDMDTGAKIFEYRYVPVNNGSGTDIYKTGAQGITLMLEDATEYRQDVSLLPATTFDSNNLLTTGAEIINTVPDSGGITLLPTIITGSEGVVAGGEKYVPTIINMGSGQGKIASLENVTTGAMSTLSIDEEILNQTGGNILVTQNGEPIDSLMGVNTKDIYTGIGSVTDFEFEPRVIRMPNNEQIAPGVTYKEENRPNIEFVVVDDTKMPLQEVTGNGQNIINVGSSVNETLISEEVLNFERWLMDPNNYSYIEEYPEYMDMLKSIFSEANGEVLNANVNEIIGLMDEPKYVQAYDVTEAIIDYVPSERKKELIDILLRKLESEDSNEIHSLFALRYGENFRYLYDTQSGIDYMEGNVGTIAKIIVDKFDVHQVYDTYEIINNIPHMHKQEMFRCIMDELLLKNELDADDWYLVANLTNLFDDVTLSTSVNELLSLAVSPSLLQIPNGAYYNELLGNTIERVTYIMGENPDFYNEFMQEPFNNILDRPIRDICAIVEKEVPINPNIINEDERMNLAYQIYMNKTGIKYTGLETPNMEQYSGFLSTMEDMGIDKYKEFFEDASKLRILNGILPENYCDYIIKQRLNSDSALNMLGNVDDKYFRLFERAFEDKARHELAQNGIYDIPVAIVEDVGGKDIAGDAGVTAQGKVSYIVFSEDYVAKYPVKSIDVMFHEVQHKIQYRDLGVGDLRYTNEYRMLKEVMLRNDKESYYWDNYTDMYLEIDARYKALIKTKKFIESINADNFVPLSDADKLYLDERYARIKKELNRMNYTAIFKKDESGRYQFMDVIFDELLKSDPSLVEKYPILELEYDVNGNRKPTMQIISDYDDELSQTYLLTDDERKSGGFSELFAYKAIFQEQYIERCCVGPKILDVIDIVEKDAELLPSLQVGTPAAIKWRDELIKNELFVAADNTELSPEVRQNIINSMLDFANTNPGEDISKEIVEYVDLITQKK